MVCQRKRIKREERGKETGGSREAAARSQRQIGQTNTGQR